MLDFNMRILGIDYGSKRMGIALSDELGITAQGLKTINWKNQEQVLNEIGKIIESFEVEHIVVGLPARLDGTHGVQAQKVARFAELLAARFHLPVTKWDEALSSWQADEILREAGIRRDRRKDIIDKIAAQIILQNYLDSRRRENQPE